MASSDGVPARRCRPLRGSALPAWSVGPGRWPSCPPLSVISQRQARHQVSQVGLAGKPWASSQRNPRPDRRSQPGLRPQQTDRCVADSGEVRAANSPKAQRRQLPQIRPCRAFCKPKVQAQRAQARRHAQRASPPAASPRPAAARHPRNPAAQETRAGHPPRVLHQHHTLGRKAWRCGAPASSSAAQAQAPLQAAVAQPIRWRAAHCTSKPAALTLTRARPSPCAPGRRHKHRATYGAQTAFGKERCTVGHNRACCLAPRRALPRAASRATEVLELQQARHRRRVARHRPIGAGPTNSPSRSRRLRWIWHGTTHLLDEHAGQPGTQGMQNSRLQ